MDKDNDKPNIFYGFTVQKNDLVVVEVDENLVEEDFKSQKALIDFFEENIEKPNFFVNPVEYKRKKLSNYF